MIKNLLILFLLFICLPERSQAQSEVDSLRAVLKTDIPDTSKVKTYLNFFYTDLFYDDPKEVIELTRNALVLSKKIQYIKGATEAYTTLGYMYRIRSENDSAFFNFNQGLITAKEINYSVGLVDAYSGLGNTHYQIGNWQEALDNFQEVINVAKAINDSTLIASGHNNVGNINLSQGILQEALFHFQKAAALGSLKMKQVSLGNIALVYMELENFKKATYYCYQALSISEQLNDQYFQASIFEQLGSISQQLKKLDSARYYYNKASLLFESIDRNYNLSSIQTNIADLYFEEGNYKSAIDIYQKSLSIQLNIDHFVGQCNNYLGLGKSFIALGNYQKAAENLQAADIIADSLRLLNAKDNVVLYLSLLNEKQGDFKKALEYQKSYKALSDSLVNTEKSKQLAEMEAKYQSAEKQKEIELLSAQNQIANLNIQQQTNFRNYLIIIAFILTILAAVAYNRFQLKAKANKKLKELDQIKTSFFTNISHEFRTPLTLILSPLQKLLGQPDSKPFRPELTTIYKSANRLLDLTNQILDLSKLEAGKLDLHLAKGDIVEFLKVMAASFESIAEEKRIAFNCSFSDPSLEVYYDDDKLQKIVNNLLSNAFKFTPSGGQVSLTLTHAKNTLAIAVIDTGKGLSEKEQLLIFERFYQGEANSHSPGTGIGLTLTNELVALHQGTLHIKSKKEEGTTFTFKIPMNKDAYPKDKLTSKATSDHPANDTIELSNLEENEVDSQPENVPMVLIVEDNKDLRKHISNLLKEDYQINESVNGRQGVETAIQIIPDLIISDLMMPEVDGITLCKELKSDERTSHIPIILLTAKAEMSSKLEGLEHGADDYLIKPFDNNELIIRVKNLIEQRVSLRSKYADEIMLQASKVNLSNPDELFIRKALELVDTHLSDTDFSVEAFQSEMGMSRMQLHRKLKALTNFSATEFIRDLRLQRAADLLSNNQMNVAEAAYSCGFNSLSYFSQCFKEKYGLNPSKYVKHS